MPILGFKGTLLHSLLKSWGHGPSGPPVPTSLSSENVKCNNPGSLNDAVMDVMGSFPVIFLLGILHHWGGEFHLHKLRFFEWNIA